MYWTIISTIMAILFGLLTGCSDQPAPAPTPVSELKPNPNPKYFLIFKGNVDITHYQHLFLQATIWFHTTNPSCAKSTGAIEGIRVPESFKYEFIVPSTRRGKLFRKIALDQYKPGRCGWAPFSIVYKVISYEKNISGAGGFTMLSDVWVPGTYKADHWKAKGGKLYLSNIHRPNIKDVLYYKQEPTIYLVTIG